MGRVSKAIVIQAPKSEEKTKGKPGLKTLESRYQESLRQFKQKEQTRSQLALNDQIKRINELREKRDFYES